MARLGPVLRGEPPAAYFTTHYGDRIARDIGIDPRQSQVDLDRLWAAMGLPQRSKASPTASSRTAAS